MNDEHARQFQSGNPFHALIGVELVERGEGRARCRLPVILMPPNPCTLDAWMDLRPGWWGG